MAKKIFIVAIYCIEHMCDAKLISFMTIFGVNLQHMSKKVVIVASGQDRLGALQAKMKPRI